MSYAEFQLSMSRIRHEKENLVQFNEEVKFFNLMKNRAVMDGNWEQVDANNIILRKLTERINESSSTIKQLEDDLGFEDDSSSQRRSKISW